MTRSVKNLTASIRALLQNKAREENRPFAEILQFYGMERFLYRFCQSKYVDKFILKGALMFAVWCIPERRTTLDIDFLAEYENKIESMEKMVKDICEISVIQDGLVFDSDQIRGQRIKEAADYEGVRVKFLGLLEKSRIPMQIDIGFGDRIYPKERNIEYPAILDFPKPKLKGYPVESVVSEKYEAIVKLGPLNSRMKDFYDIWLMMRQFNFLEENLLEALKRTFAHRKTDLPDSKPLFVEEICDEKSDRQTLWNAFLKKNGIKQAPQKLSEVALEIEGFLLKPIETIKDGKKFRKEWKPLEGWK